MLFVVLVDVPDVVEEFFLVVLVVLVLLVVMVLFVVVLVVLFITGNALSLTVMATEDELLEGILIT